MRKCVPVLKGDKVVHLRLCSASVSYNVKEYAVVMKLLIFESFVFLYTSMTIPDKVSHGETERRTNFAPLQSVSMPINCAHPLTWWD